jgi:hypothetical protein
MTVWRAARRRPCDRTEVAQALKLFRLRSDGIPDEHRLLWLIEEAREEIALSALAFGRRRPMVELARFAWLHARLWLLLEIAEKIAPGSE